MVWQVEHTKAQVEMRIGVLGIASAVLGKHCDLEQTTVGEQNRNLPSDNIMNIYTWRIIITIYIILKELRAFYFNEYNNNYYSHLPKRAYKCHEQLSSDRKNKSFQLFPIAYTLGNYVLPLLLNNPRKLSLHKQFRSCSSSAFQLMRHGVGISLLKQQKIALFHHIFFRERNDCGKRIFETIV